MIGFFDNNGLVGNADKAAVLYNSKGKTNFDVPIPTNFLSLRDQRAYEFSSTTTTSKTIFRKTKKQGFLYHLYLLLFIMI